MSVTDEGLGPFASVAPLEGVRSQPFEVTPKALRRTWGQPCSTSSTIAQEGKEGHVPYSSPPIVVGVKAQMLEVTFELSIGKGVEAPEVAPEVVVGAQIQVVLV